VLFKNNLTGLPMTADQEFQGGFTCNGVPAAPSPVGPALTAARKGGRCLSDSYALAQARVSKRADAPRSYPVIDFLTNDS
jgi:hypothetical protein